MPLHATPEAIDYDQINSSLLAWLTSVTKLVEAIPYDYSEVGHSSTPITVNFNGHFIVPPESSVTVVPNPGVQLERQFGTLWPIPAGENNVYTNEAPFEGGVEIRASSSSHLMKVDHSKDAAHIIVSQPQGRAGDPVPQTEAATRRYNSVIVPIEQLKVVKFEVVSAKAL